MRVEIVTVGREILAGLTLNTNAYTLAQALTPLGLRPQRMTTVDDDLEEIAQEIRASLARGTRLLVTTGGLGPTRDDLTLAAVAHALGLPLELHPEAAQRVKERYDQLFREGKVQEPGLTPERQKMAMLPRGSVPLPNRVGTAPAVRLEYGKTVLFCLPGVPREMQAFLEHDVLPWIREHLAPRRRYQVLRVLTGLADESVIERKIRPLRRQFPQVYFKSRPEVFDQRTNIPLELTLTAETDEDLKTLRDQLLQSLRRVFPNLEVQNA